ncbi:MAG: DNA gyrase subunit A [Saccharofermentanales bacterium]|jgi:DNA gyrase subunit A|nr:DNA gyrase subunit A [Bacillota bacterium]
MNDSNNEHIRQPITDTLLNNFMPYAMSVIISRAIPEIDGFKPAHRKLLYTMYRMKLLNSPRAKSADVVGQTMALNPHGDQTIYETMVRLTRGNSALIHPWIDSKGNFGKVYSRDMQYAAARYTEVRLDPSASLILNGLEKDAVDFIDNYSGTMKEPVLLPAAFPTILVNANQGIAVGMASNICSFNLKEVCLTTAAYINDRKHDLLETMPAPDFSTAGELIYVKEQMRRIYETGRGTFKLRGKCRIDKKANLIEIYEIPYNTTVEAIIDDISALSRKGKFREIIDVRDETDLNGLKITVSYKKNTDVKMLILKLFDLTSLETSFSCNFNILVSGRPKTMGICEILDNWISWRQDCVRREANFDRQRKEEKLHLLKALELILLDIDKAISLIRLTKTESEVIPNLMSNFGIDKVQAEFVAEIKLRHLNREYILRRIDEIAELEAEIYELKSLADSTRKINSLIGAQLRDIAKDYGRERLTTLIEPEEVPVLKEEDLIDDYNIRLFLTEEGYFKKMALTSLRGNFELKLKEGDRIVQEIETTNKAEIIFVTNKAQVYKIFAHDIEDHKPSFIGDYTPNLLELDEGESVVVMYATDREYRGQMLFVFEDRRAVRVDVSAYETKNRRRKIVSAYSDHAPLVGAAYIGVDENPEFGVINNQGKLLIFSSSQVTYKATRTARGSFIMSGSRLDKTITNFLHSTQLSQLEDPDYYKVKKLPGSGRYIRDKAFEDKQISLENL